MPLVHQRVVTAGMLDAARERYRDKPWITAALASGHPDRWRLAMAELIEAALESSAKGVGGLRSHASFLAEGCRCHKGFCAVHDR